MKFIKYMSGAHLNSLNIAMYAHRQEIDDGPVRDRRVTLRIVNVSTNNAGETYGQLTFQDRETAQTWYSGFAGSRVGRLANVIDYLQRHGV